MYLGEKTTLRLELDNASVGKRLRRDFSEIVFVRTVPMRERFFIMR